MALTTVVSITDEPSLDTAIADGNVGPTTGTFTKAVTETAAPTPITNTVSGNLTLDGANYTLTGDGTDAALVVAAGGMVTVENLNIANSGGAAAISVGTGGTVTFQVGTASGDTSASTIGYVSAPIVGAGGVTVGGGAAQAPLILAAANTYTGATVINTGAGVVLSANGSINNSASVNVAGKLDITAAQNAVGGSTSVTLNALTDSGTIVLGSNSISTTGVSAISGAVNGAGGLTVTSGTTTVTGAEAYTGSTRVFGDLVLGAGGSVANSSNVSLKASGAILDITNATNVNINELTGVAGSSVVLGANVLGVTETLNASFSGVISGSGGLTLNAGPGELTLAGANTYTGSTTINSGAKLGLTGAGTLGVPATNSTLTVNGTFDLTQDTAGSYTFGAVAGTNGSAQIQLGSNRAIFESPTVASSFGGVISGSGAVQVGIASTATPPAADATTLTLSGTNTYTGSTVVYGHLAVNGSIAQSSNVSLKVNGASVDFSNAANSGTFFTTSNDGAGAFTQSGVLINELTGVAGTSVTLNNGKTLIINETLNASFSGVISGNGGIVDRGPATLTLNGTNTYTGETLIKGHLALGASGSITNSVVYDNGVFDVSAATGPVAVRSLFGDNANASVVLGANTLDVTGSSRPKFSGQQYSFAGVISGSGGVTVDGDLYLSNANTYTGVTTVNNFLELDQGGSIAGTSIVNNGEIDINESGVVLANNISGSGYIYIDQSYSYAKGRYQGHGSVTITVADTYTGTTKIEDATLTLAAGGSIVNSGVFLDNTHAVLDLTQAGGTVTLNTLYANAGSVMLGANNLVLAGVGSSGTNYFNGVISGSGGVQIDSGTGLDVYAAQTYTGSTVVYGALTLEDGISLASSNVSLKGTSGAGGSLNVNGAVSINELTGEFGTTVALNSGTLSINETVAATFAGVISGGGAFTVGGSAYLTLTNTESYSGVTTITGDLALAAATGSSTIGSIQSSSGVVDNGFFAIAGSTTINDLTGHGVVKIGPAPDVLTVYENVSGAFSGTIHGAGVLNVDGYQTLTLSGTTSDFSGGTHLSGSATLEVAAMGAVGSGAITFTSGNATLQLDNAALTGGGTATESFGNTIDIFSAGGTVDLSGLIYAPGAPQSFTVGAGGLLAITEGNVTVTLHTDLGAGTHINAYADSHGYTAFHYAGSS